MEKKLSRRFVVLLSCLVVVYAAQGRGDRAAGQSAQVNPDAKILQDFSKRVDGYVKLRNDMKKHAPRLKETADPSKIQAAQEGLGDHIRAARKEAKQGDIFSPDTAQLFRRLMNPEMKGREGADIKQTIKEDSPKSVPIKVNARYPDSAPLPTVPPALLAALPKLPEDLEYRIINRDLILLDVHANVIVDFIRNAIS